MSVDGWMVKKQADIDGVEDGRWKIRLISDHQDFGGECGREDGAWKQSVYCTAACTWCRCILVHASSYRMLLAALVTCT